MGDMRSEEIYTERAEERYVFVSSLLDICDRPMKYLGDDMWEDHYTKQIYIVG